MKTLALASAAALIALANPANAQLLGGGLGGGFGGGASIIPTIPVLPPLPSVPSVPNVGANAVGNVTGSAAAATSHNVDTRSGKAGASASGNAQGNGSLTQTATAPLGSTATVANGSANASGSGRADAQLIGTDALSSTAGQAVDVTKQAAGSARSQASGLVSGARDKAGSALNGAGQAAGSATANLTGAADGSVSALGGNLALAGSLAGNSAGSFDVKPGMKLFDASGEKIGKVKDVIADAHGTVQELVVKVDGAVATLPAANFSGNGELLVSAMGEGAIKSTAAEQKAEPQSQPETTAQQ